MIGTFVIRCLNFHAAYRCRHAGACCQAGWTIPFDAGERERLRPLTLAAGSIIRSEDGTMAAARHADGTCAFFDRDTRLCAIHRGGGQRALPVSCRMFPRSVLHDARGTFVSLSHFCPTAAALLFAPGPPAAIVQAPDSLVDVGQLDGLDARAVLPPLLRDGMLMDYQGHDAWERLGVGLLAREDVAPAAAVDALSEAATRILAWEPRRGPLADAVRTAFAAPLAAGAPVSTSELAVKRWLASRLFACWLPYQGRGLAAIAEYIRGCFDLFNAERARDGNPLEAIRRSDLRIMHTA